MVSRIAELEAYRTMYREQMSSIRRELQQIGVPQAKILSIHATHVAMLDNINQIIQLAKNEVRSRTMRLQLLFEAIEHKRTKNMSQILFYFRLSKIYSSCSSFWNECFYSSVDLLRRTTGHRIRLFRRVQHLLYPWPRMVRWKHLTRTRCARILHRTRLTMWLVWFLFPLCC